MKSSIAVLLALAASLMAAPVLAQVGVSVQINQPGVYGRIDFGDSPPPLVVYPQPVIYAPTPVAVHQNPIYLYVPSDHQREWGRYCGRYSACGQPVYFVQERWVQERASQHRDEYRHERKRGDKGHGHGHGHGGRDDDRGKKHHKKDRD